MSRLARGLAVLFVARALSAQDSPQQAGGVADVSLQSYFLGGNSQPFSSLAGPAVAFRQYLPGPGMITGNIEGYAESARGRIGTNFVTFEALRWKGRLWSVTGGDFRVRSALVPVPFTNYLFPEIGVRGVKVEMSDGVRHYRFFGGEETLQQGPRISFRTGVPQSIVGAEATQSFGTKLQVGVRYWGLSSSDKQIVENALFFPAGSEFHRSDSLSAQSSYMLRKNVSIYSEADLSAASRPGAFGPRNNAPFSWLAGALWQTKKLTVRGNYGSLSRSVLPVIGYYFGDRKGPYGEVKYKPFHFIELFGSALQSANNLEHNPGLASYKTTDMSAGAAATLPWRFGLSGQYSKIGLVAAQASDPAQDQMQHSTQVQASISRPVRAHHNLLLMYRDLDLRATTFNQKQKSVEVQDNVQYSRFGFGVAARGQQQLTLGQLQNSLFVRGNGQVRLGRVAMFAQFEAGNDLINKTLFAVNTVNTTVAGMSVSLLKGWTMNAEVFRSSLLANLNPYSIFVLQARGAGVSDTLSDFNQWSFFARFNHRVKWGAALPEPTAAAAGNEVIYGSIEGMILESGTNAAGLAGISVRLDGSRLAVSDATGKYHFLDVFEGAHKVELNLDELPAEYTPGPPAATVSFEVKPRKIGRLDFHVVRTNAAIQGTVRGLAKEDLGEVHLDRVVINLGTGERYTTCDRDGAFGFFNLTAGVYQVSLDVGTLPENYVLLSEPEITVDLTGNSATAPLLFAIEKREPKLRIRKVFEGTAGGSK